MFCEQTRQELIRASVGADEYNKMSPRQQIEHGHRLDEVIKKAVEREPHKFQDNAFRWQFLKK